MPLYEYLCLDCGAVSEVLVIHTDDVPQCRECDSQNLKKLLSAHSSISGGSASRLPGHGDTGCCGSHPAEAGCPGPGSCCGKR